MNKIKLLVLILTNFKGIKKLTIPFKQITYIRGDNATGKTTIFDAHTWLLFDKDSNDRQNFEIKTLDSNNEVIHGLDHQVTGILSVDGKEITLTKILREKWTKKKGEADRQFTGNETLYYINEVPVKKQEYQAYVSGLIDEQIFKLICNPLYFSVIMKWQDRKNVIMSIIGDIEMDKIIDYKPELKALLPFLKDTDIETLRRSIAARKVKLNKEIRSIPFRIDECNNSIKELDFEYLDMQKRGILSALSLVEEQLISGTRLNDKVIKERDKLYALKAKLKDLEYNLKNNSEKPVEDFKTDNRVLGLEKNKLEYEVDVLEMKIHNAEKDAAAYNSELVDLKAQWKSVNTEKLDLSLVDCVCPTCKRELDGGDIEAKKHEMLVNFNEVKAKNLANIKRTGNVKKERIAKITIELEKLKEDKAISSDKLTDINRSLQIITSKINSFKPVLDFKESEEYEAVLKNIETLEMKIKVSISDTEDIAQLKAKKFNLSNELESINHALGKKVQNQELKTRITELSNLERRLSLQIAELEGQEFLCEGYTKAKVELLEATINNKFKYVSFKFVNTLVNGGLEDCCEALIDGVPFADANTASQINGGLDIINVLCDHYNVSAPIFIDNRESINEILECNSQIVNLIVSDDKVLTVNGVYCSDLLMGNYRKEATYELIKEANGEFEAEEDEFVNQEASEFVNQQGVKFAAEENTELVGSGFAAEEETIEEPDF